MLFFNRRKEEKERIQEDSRTNRGLSRFDKEQTSKNEDSSRSKRAELDCEEAIVQEKERFGRVRKSLMNYLRVKYGDEMANRALWRVNRRRTEGYFKI